MTTNFGKAANPMFADPPGCLFHHQASFITDFFKNEAGAPDGDFDFFVMPDIDPAYTGAITTAGDLFGMFNDTPQAQSLIQYLLTAEAQQIWVENGRLHLDEQERPARGLSGRHVAQFGGAAARRPSSAKFDGVGPDAERHEPGASSTPIVEYVENPGNLDTILTNLDSRPGGRLRRLTYAHSTAPAA